MNSGLFGLNALGASAGDLSNRMNAQQYTLMTLMSDPKYAGVSGQLQASINSIRYYMPGLQSGSLKGSDGRVFSLDDATRTADGIDVSVSNIKDNVARVYTPQQLQTATANMGVENPLNVPVDADIRRKIYAGGSNIGPGDTGYTAAGYGSLWDSLKATVDDAAGAVTNWIGTNVTTQTKAQNVVDAVNPFSTPAQKTSSPFSTLYPSSPTSPRPTDAGAVPPTMTSSGTTKVEESVSYPHSSFADLEKLKKQDSDAAAGDWATIGAGVAAGLAPSLVSLFSPGKGKLTGKAAVDAKKAKLAAGRGAGGAGGAPSKGVSTTTIVLIAGIAVLVLGVAGVGIYSATKKKD